MTSIHCLYQCVFVWVCACVSIFLCGLNRFIVLVNFFVEVRLAVFLSGSARIAQRQRQSVGEEAHAASDPAPGHERVTKPGQRARERLGT